MDHFRANIDKVRSHNKKMGPLPNRENLLDQATREKMPSLHSAEEKAWMPSPKSSFSHWITTKRGMPVNGNASFFRLMAGMGLELGYLV